jgi:serine/threonine protein kinase
MDDCINVQSGMQTSETWTARSNDVDLSTLSIRDPFADPDVLVGQVASFPAPGMRLGPYELIRELGRGGMGTVYLARDTKLGRRVAIKFLKSAGPGITARFNREARATARCSHENIVVIHEVGEHQGQPFMVLEYLEGAPLSRQITAGQRIPPPRAVELMVPVVRALVCAHVHRIVHRDLKPENIFVTHTGMVKVLDFGVAKLLREAPADAMARSQRPGRAEHSEIGEGDAVHTSHGAILGTIPYMSPEQWRGHEVDHRTDVWAAGIILYQMVAGQHPLTPLTREHCAVVGSLGIPMPSVRALCPDLPIELANLIDQCLIKHKDGRLASAQALLDGLEPLLPGHHARPLRTDQNPYPGLRSFQKNDANRFFGRNREIAAAAARLRDVPLLAVVGPSGAGKSSFVRAGLVPALDRSGEAWTTLVVRPGRRPLDALAQVVDTYASDANTVLGNPPADHAMRQRLLAEPGYLGTALRSRAHHKSQKVLVFVDQFEELYTLGADQAERRAFTACLASAADDATTPVRVVLSLRSDFLDRVAEDSYFFAELIRGLFFLTSPGRDDLREALVAPAELAGFRFQTPTVVEHMLDHLVHVPGALPLLQFAATKLWDARDQARHMLTEDSYTALGGVAGALASHADAVVAELPTYVEGWQPLARALFLRLVTLERTRALVPIHELGELAPDPATVQHLVDHLVSARLLVVQNGDSGARAEGADRTGATVEIVHESLIQTWPRLRRWLDENQDDAAFLDQLRTAARQWQARGRPEDLLWRGEVMLEARHWHRRYRGELPELQASYLASVFALAERSARRTRWLMAGTMAFLALLAAAAVVAMLLIRDAQQASVRQASVARAAEAEAHERLGRVQAEEQARRVAESRERSARQAAEQASVQVELINGTLAAKNAELLTALRRATEAGRHAREAQAQAEQKEADALQSRASAVQAEAEVRHINRVLQALLAREQTRVRLLGQKGGAIFEQLTDQELNQ